MKNVISLFVFLLCAFNATAQVTATYFEGKDAFESFPALRQTSLQNIAVKRMPTVDTDKLLEEDRLTEGMDVPFRFGYGFDVNYNLNDGEWIELDTISVWSLKFDSPGAFLLNFYLEQTIITL